MTTRLWEMAKMPPEKRTFENMLREAQRIQVSIDALKITELNQTDDKKNTPLTNILINLAMLTSELEKIDERIKELNDEARTLEVKGDTTAASEIQAVNDINDEMVKLTLKVSEEDEQRSKISDLMNKCISVAQVIVETSGHDINHINKDGATALYYAKSAVSKNDALNNLIASMEVHGAIEKAPNAKTSSYKY